MYGLPEKTQVNRPLTKKALFEKNALTPRQREMFDSDISRIYVSNFISHDRIPALREGTVIRSIYVITVYLKRRDYNPRSIQMLAKMTGHRSVFALIFGGGVRFTLFHTLWLTSDTVPQDSAVLPLAGFDLDAVWEGMVKYVGDIVIACGNTLESQISLDTSRRRLSAEAARLEARAMSAVQPREKYELFQKARALRQELDNMK